MSRKTGFVCAALAILAPGAALANDRLEFQEKYRPELRAIRIVVDLSQKELRATYCCANGKGPVLADADASRARFGWGLGGLIGAGIAAGIAEDRARAAYRVQEAVGAELVGFDPEAVAGPAMVKELSASPLLQGAASVVSGRPDVVDDELARGPEDAVLALSPVYYLSPDAGSLVVTAEASLLVTLVAKSPLLHKYAREDAGNDDPALYRGRFFAAVSAPPGEGAPIERWKANDGAAARLAIVGGLIELARMVAWDLQQPGPTGLFASYRKGEPLEFRQFDDSGIWFATREEAGRRWVRERSGSLGSLGDTYPALAEKERAETLRPTRPPPLVPPEVTPPVADASGALTFEFANADFLRSGGAVHVTRYSQIPADAKVSRREFADGVLTVEGVLAARGSTWGGLGPRWDLQPDRAPLDATRFKAVTLRIASTRIMLRVRLVGADEQVVEDGCYPIHMIEASEKLKEHTIPLSRFAPEPRCGSRGRTADQTLQKLTGLEVVSTGINKVPLRISVGATTLRP